MKLGLINSVWLGTSIDTVRGIELTREIGFDSIDVFADPTEISPQERRATGEACRACGLPVSSVVCCALGIADFNTSVRRFHQERTRRFLEFGYELHAKNIVLVLGEYIWNQEVITPADQWKWAVHQVRNLAEYASTLELEIAIELEPFTMSIVNNIGGMKRFLDEVNHPAALANVDISHLVLAGNQATEITQLKGRIAHVHLSDCDGVRHGDLPPGRGVVNFTPYLKTLADCEFQGVVSIELEYAPDRENIIDWVREAYQSTDQLMSSIGIRSR